MSRLYLVDKIGGKVVLMFVEILSGPNSRGWYKIKNREGKSESVRLGSTWHTSAGDAFSSRLQRIMWLSGSGKSKSSAENLSSITKEFDKTFQAAWEMAVNLGKLMGLIERPRKEIDND